MLNKELSFEEINNRIKRNIIKNVWFYVSVAFILLLLFGFAIFYQSSVIKQLATINEKNSWKVLALNNGIPTDLPLVEITPEEYEDAIKILIRDHLVLSRDELTNGLNKGAASWQEVVKRTEKLREFYQYYIQPNDVKKLSDEQQEYLYQANREFSAFVTKLLQMLVNNTIPTQISITSSRVNKFTSEKNVFTTVITVEYKTTVVKPNINQILKGDGHSTFTIMGYIDNNQKNAVNKVGIRPFSFKADLQEIR